MMSPGELRKRLTDLQAGRTTLPLAIVFLTALLASPSAQAQFKVLHVFSGMGDGGRPFAAVITDASGNLYGTTLWGGNLSCNSGNGCGVVYKMTKAGRETVLHKFAGGKDGAYPLSALTIDAQGNLYGATSGGGASGCLSNGCGTIFKISAKGKKTLLYTFTGGKDGGAPSSTLIRDKAGNLFGAAGAGGDLNCNPSYGCGVLYKLTKAGKETVLYAFTGPAGQAPHIEPSAMDAKGNIYGTAQLGGDPTCKCGVVFKLSKAGKQTVLHTFTGGATDGAYPVSGVNLHKGTLYGTAAVGGANNLGILFKITNPSISRQPAGSFTLLHSFGSGTDGASPYATVTFGKNGNLYGTTSVGGTLGYGTLYKVDTTGTESVLHSFNYSVDGGVPIAPVTIVLESKTPGGGPQEHGVIVCSEGNTIQHGPGSGSDDDEKLD
jgi:uncharacterized repeat protein (TIGR03803 family)